MYKTKIMQFSLLVFIALIVISVLNERFVANILYALAHPIVTLVFVSPPDDINVWSNESINPILMMVSITWAVGFLIAGWVYLYLERLHWTKLTIKTSYIVIILLWNVLLWGAFLLVYSQGQ